MVDKRNLLNALLARLEADKLKFEKTLEGIQRAVNEAPAPSQSHSDTTRYQMSSLENEAAQSLADKERSIRILAVFAASHGNRVSHEVQLGSVVEIEDSGRRETYFLLPEGSGIEVADGVTKALVITPKSPIASALLYRKKGDTTVLKIPAGNREVKIVDLQ